MKPYKLRMIQNEKNSYGVFRFFFFTNKVILQEDKVQTMQIIFDLGIITLFCCWKVTKSWHNLALEIHWYQNNKI